MITKKMQWDKLLCSDRQGQEKPRLEDPRYRNPFEKDFDTIIFSESFRRLKDKTQVFPLTNNAHVRNRLTHSLEVACIGRSLGRLVGLHIINKHKAVLQPLIEKGLTGSDFGDIVAAACLAHDIGNPPFGHSGENAIQSWFYSELGKKQIEGLNSQQKADLNLFEGNAQGFRIVTRLERQTGRRSMQLTYATLAALTKYPRESFIESDLLKENRWRQSAKKLGFFQSEKSIFEEVAQKAGLIRIDNSSAWWCRHPLAFIVEAADDICYHIFDLEDGFELGYIDYRTTEELLVNIVGSEEYRPRIKSINNECTLKENIIFLREKAINKLMKVAESVFIENEEKMLDGSFDTSLLEVNYDIKQRLDDIKKEVKQKLHKCQEVMSIELMGFDVISCLLNDFFVGSNNGEKHLEYGNEKQKTKPRHRLIRKSMIEEQLIRRKYSNILRGTDYVSGMTDSDAVSLFRKIKGKYGGVNKHNYVKLFKELDQTAYNYAMECVPLCSTSEKSFC
jgi:dGTPase